MLYKCAFLGCGPRAMGHAAAYERVTRGVPVACCDLNEERLTAFAERFNIPQRYTDLEEMLAREKPDLVHLVTRPPLRVELMTQLAEAGVPAVLVEKPICLGADDYKALRRLAETSRTKFAVNHQLRYHPLILQCLEEVAAGVYGEIRYLDASALYPMAGQGVHVLDLIFAFNGYAPAQSVFGASSGFTDLGCEHPGPAASAFLITFANGARATLQTGPGAPIYETGPDWGHKRIAVYGTEGFVHWRMHAWEKRTRTGEWAGGPKDYGAEDLQGQANLTEAMFDWLEDEQKPCATNLTTSLDEWFVILAGYQSSLERRPVTLPFDPPDDLLPRLERCLSTEAKHGE